MQNVVTNSRLHALALLVLGALWLQPSQAAAFELGTSTIVLEPELPNADGEFTVTTDPEKLKDYFGLANCECQEALFAIKYSLEMPPSTFGVTETVDIWLGRGCDALPENISVREMNCEQANSFPVDDLIKVVEHPYSVHDLLAPNLTMCPRDNGQQSVYAMIDEGAPGINPDTDVVAYHEFDYDTAPPPKPNDIEGSSAEEAIQLRWDLPSSSEEIRFFQVLCARADGGVVDTDNFPGGIEPEYLTTQMVCGTDIDGVHPLSPTGAALPNLPESLYNLDASTLCGEATGTQSSLRVDGLENGVAYRIVLLSVDDYRNVTAIDMGEFTPQPVEDAWEHYNNVGGHADGGYCFVATATFGNYDHAFVRILRNFRDDSLAHTGWGRDFIAWYYESSPGLAAFIAEHETARIISYVLLAPLVAFAAVWEYTGPLGKLALLFALALLIAWRRHTKHNDSFHQARSHARPRRAVLVAGAALLLLGVSATAQAQPYWDELNEPLDTGDSIPHWNVDVKFGPYYPDVDDEFGAGGPFEEVFGPSSNLMTIVTLDRFFTFPSGQLGVTGSVGFNKQYANALKLDPAGNIIPDGAGNFVRSSGDRTKFRLVPTSIGAVYRFTRLDDDFGIPVIPYGRASLAYYLWWITDPSGDVAESPTMSCPNAGTPGAGCEGDLARGGSLGYQASLGIAFRAERIDPSAEVSLRTEMGIEHAGFFAEVQMAKVDGFGANDKLSVGDTTWFGGINFEF